VVVLPNNPETRATRGSASSLSDEELALRAQRDPAQFALVYERYAPEIERYFLSRTGGNVEISQDLMSQVFVRAYTALDRYAAESLRGWLYQIARNLLIDTWRRQHPAAPLEDAVHIVANEPSLDDQVIAGEARAQLHAALDTLAEPQRSIILLRLHGLTSPEIADRLGMSTEAVKSAQYRAMARLKIALHHLHQRDDT
jgi:RNA polymerase sigma-70 factor (ECF subfamily)